MSEFIRLSNCSVQALKAKVQELQGSAKLRSCDAFLLFFIGFGDYGGQVYGTDAAPVSIKSDILQNFNSESCPALHGKPKIFCFQLARPGMVLL